LISTSGKIGSLDVMLTPLSVDYLNAALACFTLVRSDGYFAEVAVVEALRLGEAVRCGRREWCWFDGWCLRPWTTLL